MRSSDAFPLFGTGGFPINVGLADLVRGGDMRRADLPPGVTLGRPAFIGVDLHHDHGRLVGCLGAGEGLLRGGPI